MKILLTYSSLTGNTKKVAEAIYSILPQGTDLYPVEIAPKPEQYDLIIIGFWTDRASADKMAQKYMEKVKKQKVAIFGTLGASPQSDHAKETIENVKKLLMDNEVIVSYLCRGKIDPKLTERMKQLASDHPHSMSPERIRTHVEASKHPTEEDLIEAKEVFKTMIETIK